jgi:hypothetical protein
MIDLKITVSAVTPAPPSPPPPSPRVPLWRHKDDREIWGYVRSCAPCPAVWPMSDHKVPITKQWQFFIRAINWLMSLQHVAAKFGPKLALTNRKPDDIRRDWLRGLNLDRPDPDFDRVRTMSHAALTGTPGFSLLESFRLVGSALLTRDLAALRRSFAAFATANVLQVTMLDGWQDPPLKPGRTYPERVEDIRLDDYLCTPETHRHLFFGANIVNPDGRTSSFPNGAVYAWTGDSQPYTWMPHVARRPVPYRLANLDPLPAGAPFPSPYRS